MTIDTGGANPIQTIMISYDFHCKLMFICEVDT